MAVLAVILIAGSTFVLGQDSAVEIPDAGLRAAIEEALGKESGAVIMQEDMASLTSLSARGRGVEDLTGLEYATSLEMLNLENNNVADIGPVSELVSLTELVLKNNSIVALGPLTSLVSLTSLDLWGNRVVDVSPLAELEALTRLVLRSNRIADLRPLAGLTNLEHLNLGYCGVTDVSDLSALRSLRWLSLLRNGVVELDGLAELNALQLLDVRNNQVDDLTPLSGLTSLQILLLESNSVEALTPLSELTTLQRIEFSHNDIADLAPLAGLTALSRVELAYNRISNIGALVDNEGLADGDVVDLRNNPLDDAAIKSHVPALENRGVDIRVSYVLVDIPDPGLRTAVEGALKEEPGAVITAAELSRLTSLDASSAGVGDLTGLEHAVNLQELWIHDNEIGDMSPLTANRGLGPGDVVYAWRNPWDSGSRKDHIPVLRGRGVLVVAEGQESPLMPAATDEHRQGFVRAVNRSDHSATVWIHATDDSGQERTTSLALNANEAVHFNSGDLEDGNVSKGIVGIGQGDGSWRLELYSALDLEVSSHLRTRDGFLTAMQSVAPWTRDGYFVATFNPARNRNQVSSLRLVNPGSESAAVTIHGVDDAGRMGGVVELSVSPGTARTLSAMDLENGAADVDGSLGEGKGKWRLTVMSKPHLRVMSLLTSPTGHLTNLSTAPSSETLLADGQKRHRVFVFPSADDEREGFARVLNRGADTASIRIDAYDEDGNLHGPATLVVGAGETAHFNSRDLELGNAAKGISDGVGRGVGSWRLEFTCDSDITVLSYIRTPDGFLTSMHDKVRGGYWGDVYRYHVQIFNPGSNRNQESRLRLVNEGDRAARVAIAGKDDAGRPAAGGGNVMFTVPAFATHTITANRLESGDGLVGAFGDGRGKWRLSVESDRPLTILNLLASPTGHLTNLSSAGTWSAASVSFAAGPAPARGEYGRRASGAVTWRVVSASRDLAEAGVAWSITANHPDVSVEPVEGAAVVGDEVISELVADCRAPGRFLVSLRLSVGGESGETFDLPWSVTCQSENGVDLVIEQYQAPMGWSWNSVSRSFVTHVPAMSGRHTVLVGRVLYDGGTAPGVSLSIRDADGAVLRGQSEDLLPPVTESPDVTASGLWETEYVFEIPGELYEEGNEAVFSIARGGNREMEHRVTTSGWTSPSFRISFVPIHSPTGEPSEIDTGEYMAAIHELLPIEDPYEADVGDILEYEGESWDHRSAARQLLHRWNTEADADEFYLGIFRYPFDGSPCGFAWNGAHVAVAASLDGGCRRNIYPHELGHNMGLLHPPDGCGAANPDRAYPYERAGIGPRRGWLSSLGAFVNPEDGYFDTMSYCRPNFISDYHYRKAFEYRQSLAESETNVADARSQTVSARQVQGETDASAARSSLALTGNVDEYGTWSLNWAERSKKAPRKPTIGAYRLSLQDATRHELHTERLQILFASHGGGGAWRARTPSLEGKVRFVVVYDDDENVVLDEALPMVGNSTRSGTAG